MAYARDRRVRALRKWVIAGALVTAAIPLEPALSNMCYIPKAIEISAKQLKCLATNVYHEARGEPFYGQVLVAKATLNRAKDGDICKQVHLPQQFSWTINPTKIRDTEAYKVAILAAAAAQAASSPVTHFHATYVKPYWANKLTKIEQIGNHIFYY